MEFPQRSSPVELLAAAPLSLDVLEEESLLDRSEVSDTEVVLELVFELVLVLDPTGPVVTAVVLEGPVSEPVPPGPTHKPP